MIIASVSGFSIGSYQAGGLANIDGFYANGIFHCDNSAGGVGRSVSFTFWAEGWKDGDPEIFSTSTFEMWAEIPNPHYSGFSAFVPYTDDKWVALGSTVTTSLTPFTLPGVGQTLVEIYVTNEYNAHLMISDRDPNTSDGKVSLSGKVYIRKNSTYTLPSSNPLIPNSPTTDSELSNNALFEIELHMV